MAVYPLSSETVAHSEIIGKYCFLISCYLVIFHNSEFYKQLQIQKTIKIIKNEKKRQITF